MTEFPGNPRLSAIHEELEAAKVERNRVLAELGEKALPVLTGNLAFTELLAKIDMLATQTEALKKEERDLLVAKDLHEREEKERMAIRTCPQCKTVSAEGARFCEECGVKVGELPREFCKTCCTMNHPGMKFCGECGDKLAVLN